MQIQTYFPRASELRSTNVIALRELGAEHPNGHEFHKGRDWERRHVVRQPSFLLHVVEGYRSAETIGYTRQEEYIKINFWLGAKHTTVLHGFGEQDHDRPEVFLTAGPLEMVKIDLCCRDSHFAAVALCIQRDFFAKMMGIEPDELPAPLRPLMSSGWEGYVFHRYSMTPDIFAAVNAILAAPVSARMEPIYAQAKAVELMCLLMNRIAAGCACSDMARQHRNGRQNQRLYEARDLLDNKFSIPWSLPQISRAVGLNRMALTSGFRRLFGSSVFDYLQKVRMQRAYQLLQETDSRISQIAEVVGYRHTCNFSTAFHAYFGCTPRAVRTEKR